MSGEIDLEKLLASMNPVLEDETYVFVNAYDHLIPSGLHPLFTFQEREGTTLVLPLTEAETAGLPYTYRCRRITLDVHSSLDAVGFLAAILARLAASGISVNPISAYHHDHLFVPEDRAKEAFAVLREPWGRA